MEQNNNGGHAFPTSLGAFDDDGMTLRDYFAAKAMQAIMSNPNFTADFLQEEIADEAYSMADVMIEARK